jgi:hypothetical protein
MAGGNLLQIKRWRDLFGPDKAPNGATKMTAYIPTRRGRNDPS